MATISETYISITKADGSEVTAQEVYDAVMAGPCFIDIGEELAMITEIAWLDSSGTMANSTDVAFCIVKNKAIGVAASVGTKPTTSK